eukprot:545334_1
MACDKCPVNRDDIGSHIVYIKTWNQYAHESRQGNSIHHQLLSLIVPANSIIKYCSQRKCGHNYFNNKQLFVKCLWNYITNDRIYKEILKAMNTTSCCWKEGICVKCCQQFIIKTNGLFDIFKHFEIMITNGPLFKLFRLEYYNTCYVITQNHLFYKCILLKSNIVCLRKLFHLFFITYLKETDLDKLTNHCKIGTAIYAVVDPIKPAVPTDKNILNIHGFEHSLCSLSNIILSALRQCKWYHIKALFVDKQNLKSILFIIHTFLAKYCRLPHIAINSGKIYRNKIQSHHSLTIEKCWNILHNDFHVLLLRLFRIVTALYGQFYICYKKLKRTMDKCNQQQINSVTVMKHYLDDFKDISKTIMINKNRNTCIETVFIPNPEDLLWYLACGFLPPKKAFIRKKYNMILYCACCNKKQSENKRFKKCKQCQLTFYCSRKCQKYDWKINKHKNRCEALEDSIQNRKL